MITIYMSEKIKPLYDHVITTKCVVIIINTRVYLMYYL